MEASVYEVDARVQETHWWYVGRRRLFLDRIERLGVSPSAPVLDVGPSAGTNLRMLADAGFENVVGIDMSRDAATFCRDAHLAPVVIGDGTRMPFRDASFDLVLATDFVEHLDDDRAALREIERVLRPGGHCLITVPAFASLWGLQDELAHHKRRYARKEILAALDDAGLTATESFHFNYLLFAPIWLARQLFKLKRPNVKSESDINTPLVNRILRLIFAADVASAPNLHPPFGVSCLVVARKPA